MVDTRGSQARFDKIKQLLSHSYVKASGSFFAAFFLALSNLGNMHPLGLAFAASGKRDDIARFAGAFLGSLFFLKKGGVLYAAAVMICFSCRIVFRNVKAGGGLLFMPLCACLSLWCVKGAAALSQPGIKSLVLLLCEGVLCAGAAILFKISSKEKSGHFRAAGNALVLLGVLIAFEPMRLFGLLSLARTAAAVTVAFSSYFYGSTVGAFCGIFIGAMLDISAYSSPYLTLIYALGGLLCGGGKTTPKWARGLLFLAGNLSAIIWYGKTGDALSVAAECVIAAFSLAFAPASLISYTERKLSIPQSPPPLPHTLSSGVSRAVDSLGELVVSPKKSRGDYISGALDRAADGVCSTCPEAKNCWGQDYPGTHSAFMSIKSSFEKGQEITESDVPHFLAQKCTRLGRLCREMNRQVQSQKRREGARRQREESESLMARQYRGISELIDDLSAESGHRASLCTSTQSRVQQVAGKYYPNCRSRVYIRGCRLIIEVEIAKDADLADVMPLSNSLSSSLCCPLSNPTVLQGPRGQVLRFIKEPSIDAAVDTACKCRETENVCGDSEKHVTTDDGRLVLVLSDGMGAGRGAGEQSSNAADAIIRMVKAGASLTAAARAVTPALDASFESSGFVTLDMLEIDLLSGDSTFVKYGACPSFIVRGGTVQRVWQQSLPAGLNSEGSFLSCRLQGGDKVLMMTDGAVCPDSFDRSGRELCALMTSHAATDDMTAAVITLTKR